MKRRSSIQRKIMRVIMLTSGIVLIMTCAAFFVYEYITARELMRRQIYTFGQILSINSSEALALGNHSEASTTLNSLNVESSIHAAALYDKDGTLFAKYPADLSTFFLPVHPGRPGYYFNEHFL